MADKFLHMHDSLLGYVPRAGCRGHVQGGGAVTIDADSLRFCGVRPTSIDGQILAVGDSFTYGEDVGDLDTWPAQLQRLTGRGVLNGGVSGYGYDQVILRAEQLTTVCRPAVVIVGLIADDIRRTEMRRMWWHDKPWFEVEEGQLVLKGVPVPERTVLPLNVRRKIEMALFQLPPFLQHVMGYHVRVHRAGAGSQIALRLTERLARLQVEQNVKVVMMAQYDANAWGDHDLANDQRRMLQAVMDFAASNGIATLDTFRRLATEPRPRDFYGALHMNARGNRMIASLLAATLAPLLSESHV